MNGDTCTLAQMGVLLLLGVVAGASLVLTLGAILMAGRTEAQAAAENLAAGILSPAERAERDGEFRREVLPLNIPLAAADIIRRIPEMARENHPFNNERLVCGILESHCRTEEGQR